MKSSIRITAAAACLALLAGCANWSKTAKGGALGGAVGGVLGGIIGKKTGNTAAGVILGAAVGGATGAAIGNYMDKQAEEMQRDLKNAKVERIGEGIKITFDSGILFKVNKSDLTSQARSNVDDLSKILNKYEDTNILVQGHTDSTASESYNQRLSEDRAASVARRIVSRGVQQSRISAVGYGEEQPVADNGTTAGRSQNRRVEVAIWANEKLKREAEKGNI